MKSGWCLVLAALLPATSSSSAGEPGAWWNADWRFRTTVVRTAPCRDAALRPVEVAIDFPLLLEKAGLNGQFDPASLRVVARASDGAPHIVPFARRSQFHAKENRPQDYLAWIARPTIGRADEYDIYFDTRDRRIQAAAFARDLLPSENLLANPGFEEAADQRPAAWSVSPRRLVRIDRFAHTTGRQSLKIVVDKTTPPDVERELTLSQKIDVHPYAGQEMLFECDLLAERAAYGAPVSIELEQFRADGSRIMEYAVEPRWLTLELAQGQLVPFSQRGRFHPEAAEVNLRIRLRCYVRDEDSGKTVTGPDSHFTVWLDRVVIRPGELWPWPGASAGGFVDGALPRAPLNRAFEYTGQRRVAFNGGSEGTLTAGQYDPDPRAYHWGLAAGTLEFWCRPQWDSEDGKEHVFYEGIAYGHRLQSRLRKLDRSGGNQLEFAIADASGRQHTVRAPASLKARKWHHIAATWDFPKAQAQLFVDGLLVASGGPHDAPWPSSLVPKGPGTRPGIGIMEEDSRSLPMQAFLGGDAQCRAEHSAEAAVDEFRISDVARYAGPFTPALEEFPVDEHTRALFHFENEQHGVHDAGDRFVRGHLACEWEPFRQTADLEILDGGQIAVREVLVRPHAPQEPFEKNRVENRLTVTRPLVAPPDPRFVEYRPRQVDRTVADVAEEFTVDVAGDYPPLMRWITYQQADPRSAKATMLAHWRANDNVVPFSARDLAETLAPGVQSDAERAFEAFKYALATTNYYDAHYCETTPFGHRNRVSYTLTKALNIYAFDQCGPLNHMLRKMFLAAGISSNDASGTHHQFQQAFYQGDMRLFDLSPRRYWLQRDNATVASRRDFEDDLYLKLRQGIEPNSGLPGRVSRVTYATAQRPHSMDFPLQPGERVGFSWHNEGRWFELSEDRQPIPLAKIPPYFGNGAILFQSTPPLGGGTPKESSPALEFLSGGDGRPATYTYRLECPYVLSDARVRGSYSAVESGDVRLSLSFDKGKTWQAVWQSADRSGVMAVSLRDQVTARYAYWLKLELDSDSASVAGFQVRTTFVASPLALPGRLSLGENRIRLAGAALAAPLKTTCRWTERYRSDLGVSLNSISYYLDGDQTHRNLYVAQPGSELPIGVTLHGRPFQGSVSLEDMPRGWTVDAERRLVKSSPAAPSVAPFHLRPMGAEQAKIVALDVVLDEADRVRRIPVQVLVADAPLVREAEQADEITKSASALSVPEVSGASAVSFGGEGHLAFDFSARREGDYALWVRARWEPESSTAMSLTLDGGRPRRLGATSMIGFTDWTDSDRAHTKMFAHFGEQYAHWSWYRIGDVRLAAGRHRLTLSAGSGAWFDALILLPQNPVMDRAAMNLFQNWNYAPWDNAL